MAHEGLFATSAECIAKAGTAYDSTNVDEAMINAFCLQAESVINAMSRFNWSNQFSAPATTTLLPAMWHLLGQVESDLVGINMIEANMDGLAAAKYPSRIIAEDMINILRDAALRGLSILRDKKTQAFIKGE